MISIVGIIEAPEPVTEPEAIAVPSGHVMMSGTIQVTMARRPR
ncbi:MAG: hypothetical protein WEB89_10370 [Balneolales bacterium]